MIVYHHTNAASAVLRDWFRDATGSYMLGDLVLTGAFVADRPLVDEEPEASGMSVLRVELPDEADAYDYYELVEDGKSHREWCLPAEVLNSAQLRAALEDGEGSGRYRPKRQETQMTAG